MPSGSPWNLVATAYEPRGVRWARRAQLTETDSLHLVLGLQDRVRVMLVTPQGLEPQLEFPVFGNIDCLEVVRMPGETRDWIVLLSKTFQLAVLVFDSDLQTLVTVASGNVADRFTQRPACGSIIMPDPHGRFIALYIYTGFLKLVPIVRRQLRDAFNIRLTNPSIQHLCLCRDTDVPTLTVLSRRGPVSQLQAVELHLEEQRVDPRWKHTVENEATRLVPLASGVLVVGGERVALHTAENRHDTVSMEGSDGMCWDPMDDTRILVVGAHGDVSILTVDQKRLHLERLGTAIVPACVCYIDAGVAFLGSTFANNGLYRLNKPVQCIQTYDHIGPISDMAVVDIDHLGQEQIVTCSGNAVHGSLRVLRSGLGFSIDAAVNLDGLLQLWSLTINGHQHLVLSFACATRVLQLHQHTWVPIASPLCVPRPTLACRTMDTAILHITNQGARLLSLDCRSTLCSWERHIDTADTQDATLVSCDRCSLVRLSLDNNRIAIEVETTFASEIACVTSAGDTVVVGLWNQSILVLNGSLQRSSASIGTRTLARSLMLTRSSPAMLCVGDGEGNLDIFTLTDGSLSLDRRIAMGVAPVRLLPLGDDIFVCSSRPSILTVSSGRLRLSSLNTPRVHAMAPLQDGLALATGAELQVGTVEQHRRLHATTHFIQGLPRRIVHLAATRLFAIAVVRLVGDREKGVLELRRDQGFEQAAVFELDEDEQSCALAVMEVEGTTVLLVGTAFVSSGGDTPERGRLLGLRVQSGNLVLVTAVEMQGSVWSLAVHGHTVVAGVNSEIHSVRVNLEGQPRMETVHTVRGNTLALYAKIRGKELLVGDMLRSISTYTVGEDGVEFAARSLEPRWSTACAILGNGHYLLADSYHNLFVLRHDRSAALKESQQRLTTVAKINLGDQINVIRHGSLLPQDASEASGVLAGLRSELVFGTVKGRIGVLAPLSEAQFAFLVRIQDAMSVAVEGVGGFRQPEWRSIMTEKWKVEAEATHFIDGDFLHLFHDLADAQQKHIATAAGLDLHTITDALDQLYLLRC